jgi:hypothetical protein
VEPLDDCRFDGVGDAEAIDERATFLQPPSLIKGYLRLGVVVCGPPALDREFGTADFLVLLDIQKLSSEYLRRFGLVALDVLFRSGRPRPSLGQRIAVAEPVENRQPIVKHLYFPAEEHSRYQGYCLRR